MEEAGDAPSKKSLRLRVRSDITNRNINYQTREDEEE